MKNRQGFTLIELMIVVVIVGILAAIAIPRFASTKGRAFDAAARTDLRNAMTAQEAYYVDHQTYTKAGNLDIKRSKDVKLSATGDPGAYTMKASHKESDNFYCVTSESATIALC